MKTGLIVFGVVFLVFGGLLFYIPTQTAKATTTVVSANSTDTRTSYASVSVPMPLTYAVLLAGAILFILGLSLPGPKVIVKEPKSSSLVETNIETNDGKEHKKIHERHESVK